MLLWKAFRVVLAARLCLWILPLETGRTLLVRQRGRARKNPVERVVWAVRVVTRFVPQATCLVQALALQSLLSAQGDPCSLVVGVALEQQQNFRAHAWVEYKGSIVIGEITTTSYKRLLTLDS